MPNLIDKDYKHHLPWSSLIWVLREGEILLKDGVYYTVVNCNTRDPVPGAIPTLRLKPHVPINRPEISDAESIRKDCIF